MSATAESVVADYPTTLSPEDFSVTPSAREQLAILFKQVDEDDIQAIRVYVSGGGCGGMTYGMTFTDRKTDFDSVLEGDGFSLYVDSVALNFMRGVEIDFVERPMGGASFVFNNVFQSIGGGGGCPTCGAASGGGCG